MSNDMTKEEQQMIGVYVKTKKQLMEANSVKTKLLASQREITVPIISYLKQHPAGRAKITFDNTRYTLQPYDISRKVPMTLDLILTTLRMHGVPNAEAVIDALKNRQAKQVAELKLAKERAKSDAPFVPKPAAPPAPKDKDKEKKEPMKFTTEEDMYGKYADIRKKITQVNEAKKKLLQTQREVSPSIIVLLRKLAAGRARISLGGVNYILQPYDIHRRIPMTMDVIESTLRDNNVRNIDEIMASLKGRESRRMTELKLAKERATRPVVNMVGAAAAAVGRPPKRAKASSGLD